MKVKLSPWKQHVERWKDCTDCFLHERRTEIVLARGKVPCDILFVGDAPGTSEDGLGLPFVGPAGKLLDEIVEDAGLTEDPKKTVDGIDMSYRLAFTNLIACIPLDDDGKLEEPPPESVHACQSRLIEFVDIAKPKLLVRVGKVASDYLTPGYTTSVKLRHQCRYIDIVHPAFILRAVHAQQSILKQRAVVTLRNAVEEM